MIINNRDDYIRYRLDRSKDSYDDALILAERGEWNTVVNRLYYSCFYAVIALLLKNEIETHSHDGARNQFGLHFIKTGKIDKQYGKFFSKLFDYRQKGDYGDLYDYEETVVKPLIEEVRLFIKEIEKQI